MRGMFQAGRADARRQAERRVVGGGKRLVVVLHPHDAGDRPENLLAVDAHRSGGLGEKRRLQVEAGLFARQHARRQRRAWRLRPCRCRCRNCPGRAGSGRRPGRYACRPCSASSTTRPLSRSVTAATNLSWMPSVTTMRDDAVQRWPVEKKAPLTATSTATLRSASSSTTSGFLPPISSWNLRMCSTQAAATFLPVPTEPVKVMASMRGIVEDGVADHRAAAHDEVEHAFRNAGARDDVGKRPGRARHEVGRLEDDAIAVGERRRDLPGGNGDREIPRRDDADDADRLAGQLDVNAGPRRRQLFACRA